MAEKTDLNPKPPKLDWRTSPAHLTFLVTFIEPRPPDKHPTENQWPLILDESPEKAVERFLNDKILVRCSPRQILAHELPKLTVKKLQELSRELNLPTKAKDNKEILVRRLVVNTTHPLGLLLRVPERYLVQCSDEGLRIVEQFLGRARGGEILEETDERTVQAIKDTLLWLLKQIKKGSVVILGGVLGNVATDLLKKLLSPEELEELPPPPKIPPTETPSPKPSPAPSPEITSPPKKTPASKPPRRRQPFEPEMVHIPAGPFWMGKDDFDPDAKDWEKPRHQVNLSAYWIGKYPVTNREYQAFVRETGHRVPSHWSGNQYPDGEGAHPVVYVYWQEAVDYCAWLSRKTGTLYRLPTEAEWEKAARGTDGRVYPWGNLWNAAKCNSSEGGAKGTTPVGQYAPAGDSPYGCADMAGNVWEWCSDWFDEKEYQGRRWKTVKDPQGPEKGTWHIVRGGSWWSDKRRVACASRFGSFGFIVGSDGFRVAASPAAL